MYDGRETCEQFGGFGGTVGGGITIPIFGSGGGFGGIRGGLIPGGFQARGGSGIGPVLTLESAFGVGFTSQAIADAIRVAEQEGRFTTEGPATGAITITTGPTGLTLVLNLAEALFEVFDSSGRKLGGGVTPEAAIRAVQEGAPPFVLAPSPVPTFAEPQPLPGPAGGGDFNELLRTILGALGQIGGRRARGGLEPVAIGGSVNVPVVRGSTADPTGTVRPIRRTSIVPPTPAPPPRPPTPAVKARNVVLQALLDLLLRIRNERALRDAQRRARELLAQQRANIAAAVSAAGRLQMGFGQQGFRSAEFGLGGVGTAVATGVGAFGATLLESLLARLGQGGELTRLPNQPPGLPAPPGGLVDPLSVPGLDLSVLGGGACPSLFRTGAGAMQIRPANWFPVQAPNGKWFFFGHLGTPTFSKMKARRRHHHHSRKR